MCGIVAFRVDIGKQGICRCCFGCSVLVARSDGRVPRYLVRDFPKK